jgi:hypothetical protein
MRLSYAGIITALCLMASSGYGTALKYQANPDYLQYVSQNETRDSQPPRAAIPLSVNDQSLSSDTNKQTQDNKERPNKWLEPIVLITGAYVIVSFLMLRAINKQGEQNERQIALADNLGKWTAEQADFTRRQWRATHEQDMTLREQLTEMERLTKETGLAAQSAKQSADFLRNAERAWLTTELIFAADLGARHPEGRPTKLRIIIGNSTEEGWSVSAQVCVICANSGHTPAVITDAHIHFRNYAEVPDVPDFSERSGDYVIPEFRPIAPGKDWTFGFDVRCEGPEVPRNTLLIYGSVGYRDVFGFDRETRFAYYVRGEHLLRLPGAKFWEYNKYT